MKIKYLGTAAAEGIPGIFCECAVCKKARELGGRHIRTRAQALVDDVLLIDFGPDTYMHALQHNLVLSRIKHCIVTHSHQDHLYADEIGMRKLGFAYMDTWQPLTFYGDNSTYDMLKSYTEAHAVPEDTVLVRKIAPYVPFTVEDYTVTPIRASHDPKSDPVVYFIEKDGKNLFYGNDTSDFTEEAWDYIAKNGKKISLLSLDCTEGDKEIQYVGHMNLKRCIAMRKRFMDLGLVDENTVCVLHHFSHNGGHVSYDEFCKIAEKENFLVAYDGMEIQF